jgi:hypothetical protein
MRCALCHRNANRSLCVNCWEYSIERLKTFPSKYEQLEGAMLPSKGYGERVGGSKTPPIPVRLETLHLRTGGISKPLITHEKVIRIEQKHTRVTFRGDEYNRIKISSEYLVSQRDYIFDKYVSCDELAAAIDQISKRIDAVLGYRSELITIGACPYVDDKGETCGHRLQINPATLTSFGDIKCRACNTVWSSEKWRLLGRMLHAEPNGSGADLQSVATNNVQMD